MRLSLLTCLAVSAAASAATPASGTITASTTTQTFTTGAQPVANASGQIGDSYTCDVSNPCDIYTLTVTLDAAYISANPLDEVVITTTPAVAADDLDIQLRNSAGALIGESRGGPGAVETITFQPVAGTQTYKIEVVPSTPSTGGTTKIELVHKEPVDPDTGPDSDKDGVSDANDQCPGTPVGTLSHTDGCPGLPRYVNYQAPNGVANEAGEPSVGCNWLTEQKHTNTNVDETTNDIYNGGTVNYYGGFMTTLLTAHFNDCSSPAMPNWAEKDLVLAATPRALGDPILFTDPKFGRTWVIQLEPGAGATIDITDDDGETFLPSSGPVTSLNDFDHETIGSGPYHALPGGVPFPPKPAGVFPNAVYYAAQGVSQAMSWRSDDGGITFREKIPMWTVDVCTGLHGHVKVSPVDGTVYVPPAACNASAPPLLFGGNAAVVASEDNGLTWDVRIVDYPTGAADGSNDPSVGIATDGTLYLGIPGADGRPRMAVSRDRGLHWDEPVDVSKIYGGGEIRNMRFPHVVAGDPDRAALAFFGTTTPGDADAYDETAPDDPTKTFPGTWYLFISTTIDGGKTWVTVNASPGDPIQRGPICGDGTCRNLLDFFDAQVDKRGRLLLAGEDGCISQGCLNGDSPGDNDWTSKAFVTRQIGGHRLFKAYDEAEPLRPQAPQLSGNLSPDLTQAFLNWSKPDNGNAPILGYNVYKRVGAVGLFTKIASNLPVENFIDTAYDNSQQNFYHVTAVNRIGEGPYCLNFSPTYVIPPNPCELPGTLVLNDLTSAGADADDGANTPPNPGVNIRQVFIAELDPGTGPDKLTFTMQVAPSTNGPAANSEWFIIWNRKTPDSDFDRYYVAMRTDSQGAPSYEYGKWGVPLDTSIPPGPQNPNANTPSKIGDADGGYYDPVTGVIRIVVSNSKLENVKAGDTLPAFNARSFLGRNGIPGQRSQNNASDITGDENYTLRGGLLCKVNTKPIAVLTPISATTGAPPLTVTFDVSTSSDPDVGDSIAKYTVQFGDEEAVVITPSQSKTVQHTYEEEGTFTAVLRVEDSRGEQNASSDPLSKVTVTVGTPPIDAPDNNRLGGALPALSLILLAGLGVLRRRR